MQSKLVELSHHTKKYWEEKDVLDLEQAETLEDLLGVALRIASKMPQPLGQVCGPISSGGAGTVLENLVIFNENIIFLQSEGKTIFDQMPFEDAFIDYKNNIPVDGDPYAVLHRFYKPFLESGFVKKLYFIKGWEGSYGANWEHDQAKRLGIEIEYL